MPYHHLFSLCSYFSSTASSSDQRKNSERMFTNATNKIPYRFQYEQIGTNLLKHALCMSLMLSMKLSSGHLFLIIQNAHMKEYEKKD